MNVILIIIGIIIIAVGFCTLLFMFLEEQYCKEENATKAEIVKKTRKDGKIVYDIRLNGYWKLPFWWHCPRSCRNLTEEAANEKIKQMVSERLYHDNATIVEKEITNNITLK